VCFKVVTVTSIQNRETAEFGKISTIHYNNHSSLSEIYSVLFLRRRFYTDFFMYSCVYAHACVTVDMNRDRSRVHTDFDVCVSGAISLIDSIRLPVGG